MCWREVSAEARLTIPQTSQGESNAGPEGQTFSKPVTVTLAIDPSRLPEDVPGDDISIVTSKATGTPDYSALPTTIVDRTHVSAQTIHFSIFLPVWGRTQPCGNGRIPASAVCCDKGSVTSSSYCTGKPGTNTSSGSASAECLANAAGTTHPVFQIPANDSREGTHLVSEAKSAPSCAEC